MKEISVIVVCFLIGSIAFAQKMMTRAGEIKFDASMPELVEIAATSNTVSCILDEATGDFVALALVKSFKFKSPLMEEHYNENYMESSKFPKATFKGKIKGLDASKLSSRKENYELEGEFTLHGVTKNIKTKIYLSLYTGKVFATCSFTVKAQDYKIEIPSLVKEKFAENIKVNVDFVLEAK